MSFDNVINLIMKKIDVKENTFEVDIGELDASDVEAITDTLADSGYTIMPNKSTFTTLVATRL